ncbi:uncharacterized protein LOC122079131 [Macadamia integrifolia]|uniref:uncharacterized protein LOC122079131 n=1 Tax=Macadamia integrifolia TaxID=60698 RepID=UPI001C4FA386|nr:uncharacterized protein LOC122079131 [Macadamia integrifolia]XP_042501321.1 uncharacterized protein LOC122079131 [Macadamia integrifolia]
MECNKDEATRAKEIAEKKYTAKDIAGAKKFVLKAQNLYPGLEGLPQMLATFDVYISAENKICGEADWYGILGVSPLADDETVKKQYRKLALMIHPDKNKSVGADEAFKLISEAWSILSDKAKRIAYDQKRNVKAFQRTTTANSKPQKSANPRPPPASKSNMFGTACNHCKMKCKYLGIYINHNLLCPNCHEPFYVVQNSPLPSNGSNTAAPWTFSRQFQNSNHHGTNKNAYAPGRNTAAPAPNMRAAAPGSAAGQAATVGQQAHKKVRREREEVQEATRGEDALQRKNVPLRRWLVVCLRGFLILVLTMLSKERYL